MNIIEAINSVESDLADAGIESARLDAEVIIAHALGTDRSELYLRRDDPIEAGVLEALGDTVARRSRGCPVAYITGTKEFWSIPIEVNEGVLIPRPDTETLVEETLRLAGEAKGGLRILDLCTGSGCIAAALAKELPDAELVASDISGTALEVAGRNVAFAGGRVALSRSDLFADIEGDRRFDFIVSNPPYIREDEFAKLSRDIVDFEPRGALAAGESGLDFITRIIEDGHRFLAPGGWLLMEIGEGQSAAATAIAIETDRYDTIRTAKDLAGIDRVISLRRTWTGN
jgi:release factor glutamine methyltransferase